MSRVTVIVPTYNEAENVERLANEVLAQDARVHVLVVDDNSPDGTGKLADELSEHHRRRASTSCIAIDQAGAGRLPTGPG